jgi:hypothetical protein
MTHARDMVQLKARSAHHSPSWPAVTNRGTRAARQPNAPAATLELTGRFSMCWSTGPDGRLYSSWDRPTPRETNQTEDRVGWKWAELASSDRSMLARARTPEALPAC